MCEPHLIGLLSGSWAAMGHCSSKVLPNFSGKKVVSFFILFISLLLLFLNLFYLLLLFQHFLSRKKSLRSCCLLIRGLICREGKSVTAAASAAHYYYQISIGLPGIRAALTHTHRHQAIINSITHGCSLVFLLQKNLNS